jgi:hypothetical protein
MLKSGDSEGAVAFFPSQTVNILDFQGDGAKISAKTDWLDYAKGYFPHFDLVGRNRLGNGHRARLNPTAASRCFPADP